VFERAGALPGPRVRPGGNVQPRGRRKHGPPLQRVFEGAFVDETNSHPDAIA